MKLEMLLNNIIIENQIIDIQNKIKSDLIKTNFSNYPDFEKDFEYYTKLFIDTIPTPKKYLNKFINLVVNNSKLNEFTQTESYNDIYEYFTKWFDFKSRNLINKDILMQNVTSFKDIVDDVSKIQNYKGKTKDTNKIFEDNDWLLLKINTKEASCKYGSNTKWCISGERDNPYDDELYSKSNLIYFLIDKKPKKDYSDSLYKVAFLVNKNSGAFQVWDAKDDRLSIDSVNYVKKFIPQIFDAIGKDYVKFKDILSIYSLQKSIRNYSGVNVKYVKDYSLISDNIEDNTLTLFYTKEGVENSIEVRIDLDKQKLEIYFLSSLRNSEVIMIASNTYDFENSINGVLKLIKSSIINIFKNTDVIKYFNENPQEYFNGVKLYNDINDTDNIKVPKKAFIKAIKLLRDNGTQTITNIRRIVDPNLLSSHNVKPLLKSLYRFGLIKIEKRGRNILIVPTPKLIKTPIDRLI
jgi:hypothetical protein